MRRLHCESLEQRLVLNGDALICVDYVFIDPSAPQTPLTSLEVGQDYLMQTFIKDNRPGDPLGIGQIFFDVTYDSELIAVNGELTFGPNYDLAATGDTSVPGFIDQVGALRDTPIPAIGTFLLYTLPFRTEEAGTLDISAQPDDVKDILFVLSNDPVALEDINFDGNTIAIVDSSVPMVSIAATQNGNEAGTVPGTFTVTQSMTTGANTVVEYTVGGSANSGNDFTPLSGTATITAGETSTVINVPVIDDATVEATETVSVTLDSISQGDGSVVIDGGADEATLNILDNDSAQVSIAATTGGNEAGAVAGQFTVTQSAPSSTNTVVSFTLDGSADSGSDYTAIPTSVTILAGSTSAVIDVPVIDDSMVEGPETVVATLSGITAGDPQISLQGGGTEATITIADNDTALVRVETTTNPDEDGPTNGVFTVTQSAVSPSDTVIAYSLSGTATAGDDYMVPSGTVTILAGQTTATVTVPVLNDSIVEADETVMIHLDSITNGNPQVSIDGALREATMTIADNDSALVSIAKTSDGGETGPTGGLFTVTQTALSSTDTVVSYSVDGTATAGADYTALSGTVTIPAGETSATIDVPVIDDEETESSETVIVTLGNISDGDPQIQVDGGQNEATVEIADNETPRVSIANTNDANEDGPVAGRFTVSQTSQAQTATIVSYTVTGTATSGDDYEVLSGTVTILAGETSATIDVPALDDESIEGLETVIVTLNEITSGDENLEIDPANQQATVGILDDESGLVSIVATDDGAEDGPTSGLFTISQDGIAAIDTIVNYTVSGTATSGDDYVSLSGSATIVAGQTSTTILLSVVNDSLVEPDETVIVTLTSIAGSPLVDLDPQQSAATATIVDDDAAQVRFDSTSDGSEDDSTVGVFTIVQTAASSTDTVIQYSISGAATAGDDYTALSGTVTLSAGETSATIEVPVIDDNLVESTENVMLTLTTLETSGARVTIDAAADDAAIEITDNDTALVSVTKSSDGNEAGATSVVFEVIQSAPSSTATEIQYTIGGTATAGDDYTAPSGTVIIPAGSTSQFVTIPVIDDIELEDPETVTILLDSIAGDPQITIDLAGDNAAADIVDNETGLIGISVTTVGSEAGPTPGQFTLTQNGTTDVDTVISYSVTGTATAGDDYVALSSTATIPAGQTSAAIDVTVIDDLLIEGEQTVIVTLDSFTGDQRLVIDSAAASATMSIAEDDTGLVSIAPDGNASEEGTVSGSFVVSQSGIAEVDTVVSYTVSGSAASGSDFNTLSGIVTIPAGQTSAAILVEPVDDGVVEATENVVVTLTGITSGSDLVQVDTANDAAAVDIADNDSAQVSLSATADGNETGSAAGVFTVTQSATSSTDTVISYTVGGTAASGSDFTALSGTVTIPAGQTSATINVPVIDDAVVEGTENVELTLGGITGGDADITLGSQINDSLEILDNDNAAIAFVDATSSVFEIAGSHTVIVRLSIAANGTLGQSVTVNVADTGGTATAADFMLDTTSVTFAAGSQDGAEQSVTLTLIDDGVLEPDETVMLGLSLDDGAGFPAAIGPTGTHTATIVDDPMTGVVSGVVWADTNGNGNRDADEIVIPGVTVRLAGVDGFGATVNRTTRTDENGIYSFGGLAGGIYDVTQQHPQAFNDGQESLGTVAGSPSGQVGNDQFTGITLGPTEEAVNYNFGEWGLMSRFVNVRLFLSRTNVNDFILRDTIAAAETSPQTQIAASSQAQIETTSTPTAAPAAIQVDAGTNAGSEPTPPPVTPASSQLIASAAAGTTAQPPSSPPPAPPALSPTTAAAADATIASPLASSPATLPGEADSAIEAVAFAAGLSANDPSPNEPGASPLVGTAHDESPTSGTPSSAPSSASGMLLEDPALGRNVVETSAGGQAADEQLTDQALDDEESWLDELMA